LEGDSSNKNLQQLPSHFLQNWFGEANANEAVFTTPT
jgi:hypothetical protein